jgi:hypothetical protein
MALASNLALQAAAYWFTFRVEVGIVVDQTNWLVGTPEMWTLIGSIPGTR